MLADLRDALRQLRKAPGVTTTAVITLALGIGATTAIFTLVHQVMLKSLPVTNPDELWRIGDKVRCCNWGGYTQGDDGNFSLFSWEAYKHFRSHTPEFVDLAALQAAMPRSASVEPGRKLRRIRVTGNTYPAISSGHSACNPGSAG
jgi:putative ABC transport system permease protein